MVFEVRDARIPFTSANDDLDKIVGPSKARLIVLNKVCWCLVAVVCYWCRMYTASPAHERGLPSL